MTNKLLCLFLVFNFERSSQLFGQDITAIICALPEEASIYNRQTERKEETKICGVKFTTGFYKDRKIVFAESGIGKVNAAVITTLLIEHFKPGRVIFTGIAGGLNPTIKPGDIIIADSLTQHDFGSLNKDQSITHWGAINPITNERNPVFFRSDSSFLSLAKSVAKQHSSTHQITNGIIVTGDQFISSTQKKNELRIRLKADAVEMEGAATAQVCYQFNTPFIVIRSISDVANDKARMDYESFKKIAAQNAGNFVLQLIEKLPATKASITQYHKVELLFGLNAEGKTISEEEWQKFVDQYITPAFPSGLTILNADGQWQSEQLKQVIKEKSKMVILICEKTSKTEEALKFIKEKYRALFKQESVLQIDSKTETVLF